MLSRPERQGSRLNDFRRENMALVRRSPCRSPEIIASFAIIQADDYAAALAITRARPGDNVIEVGEMASYS